MRAKNGGHERSNSAAICRNETFRPRSDFSLSQARFACHGARPPRASSLLCSPAIGLGDVRGKREHHVIDKELVDFVRPTQRVQERAPI